MAQRERTIIGAYVLALVVFAAVASYVYVQFERYGDRTRWVQHTLEVLNAIDEGLGQLKDIETGERGYLLAGEEDFLEPYERAIAVVREQFAAARALVADNPAQVARLDALAPLVERKIAFCDATIAVYRRGEHARAHAMVASRDGKLVMDEIRRRIDAIERAERALLDERSARAREAGWRTTTLLVFGNGLAFALLALGTLVLGRELNRRSRVDQERTMRDEQVALRSTSGRAERRLQAALDELPIAIGIAEAGAGDFAVRNHRLRELAGEAALELRQPDGAPVPPRADPFARALRDGATVRGAELWLERPGGAPVAVVVDAAPIREHDGRVLGAVGIFHDAAELRRTEAQRQEGERFRDVFVGALGHDLRNPLSVMTAGAASLAQRVTAPADVKLVQRMTSSAQRMARMVDQLLDLTEARLGGGIAIERHRMDLGELARNVLDRIDVAHPERTLVLATEGELAGAWDGDRLAEVIRDLVENALEHGRPDTPIEVAVRAAAREVTIEVTNQGNPIPAELLPLIFDPFRRAAERKRTRSSGLGIGLYLAQQIVRAHGGTIAASSTADAGTSFRVTLPRADG